MLIAIDTATRVASLALHDGFQLRHEVSWEAGRQQTVQLTQRLASSLENLKVGVERLKGVAVSLGPGSYTGLRVGLAVAKGLALSRSLPLVGVPTLDILATGQGRDRRPLVTVIQAGRGRIAVATYRWHRGWRQREEPRLTTWEELGEQIERPTLFCGEVDRSGAKILEQLGDQAILLPPAWRLRRAGFLADIAWARIRQGKIDDAAALAPIYLR